MAQFPALPLFTDAYLADTFHLSDAQHGIYLKLLMLTWRSPGCRIPNDDQWLATRLQRPVDRVIAEVRPLLAEFYSSTGNWLVQKRLLREWEWCKKKSKSQSDIAKSRWAREKDLYERSTGVQEPAYAEIATPAMPPTPPYPSLKESKKDAASAAPEFEGLESKPGKKENGGVGHDLATDEKSQFYAKARKLFGVKSGGFAKLLLDAKDGNVALARAALEMASTKGDGARAYVGRIINGAAAPVEQQVDPHF